MHYINLAILIGLVGLLIGFYIHMDKKVEKLSDEIKSTHKELSDEIKSTHKELSDEIKSTHKELSDEIKSTHKELSDRIDRLSDRIDRLYDIQVHAGMGLRPIEHNKDKAANE
jgi:uncharacterized protein YoxC